MSLSKKEILITLVNKTKKPKLIDDLYPFVNIFLDITHFNYNEINNFNNIDLKYNCQKYNLNTIGTKIKLIKRLYGIIYPAKMPEDAFLKKRGRKTNNNQIDKKKK